MPLLQTPRHSQASLAQSLVDSLLLSPGFWCAENFFCALPESVSLVLWKFSNQILLAIKVRFPAPLPDLHVGKSLAGPRTFIRVQERLLFFPPVCGLSTQRLCGGTISDLLQEDLGHMPFFPGMLLLVSVPVAGHCSPCLCRRHSYTHKEVWLSLLWRVTAPFPGSWCAQGFVCFQVSGECEV